MQFGTRVRRHILTIRISASKVTVLGFVWSKYWGFESGMRPKVIVEPDPGPSWHCELGLVMDVVVEVKKGLTRTSAERMIALEDSQYWGPASSMN